MRPPVSEQVRPRPPEDILAEYRATGDRRLRNQVVEAHRWLAVVVARDYCTGSEPLDDLIQVACVALLKAAERFDPTFGVEFKTFAAVTARGELRRYYRDSTWSIRVPRRLQELRYEVRAATELLRERLRRAPTTADLAEYLHVDADEIIDCLCADSNFRSLSIDRIDGGENMLGDGAGRTDDGFAEVEAMDAFREVASLLPARLRRVVEMRFVDQMKQSDIAAVLGVSQVHVSRLLRHAAERLRPQLEHRGVKLDEHLGQSGGAEGSAEMVAANVGRSASKPNDTRSATTSASDSRNRRSGRPGEATASAASTTTPRRPPEGARQHRTEETLSAPIATNTSSTSSRTSPSTSTENPSSAPHAAAAVRTTRA